jgi:hypothetical protein
MFATSDMLKDSYGHRFFYRVSGTSWTLTSAGRDGRLGGRGFDADKSDPGPLDPIDFTDPINNVQPTFFQFWFRLPTVGAFFSNFAVSLLAFGVALRILSRRMAQHKQFSLSGRPTTVVSIAVLLIFCIILAQVLSNFAIPTRG